MPAQTTPDPSRLSDEELSKLALERATQFSRAKTRGNFLLYKPLSDQRDWFECQKPITCILVGNRRGKTTAGSVKTISSCTGHLPLSLGGVPPLSWAQHDLTGRRFLVVAESFEVTLEKDVLPKLKEYLAPGMLHPTRKPKFKPGSRVEQVFYFSSGAELHVMSYQQEPKSFEGAPWHGAWFNEPPPEPIFQAVRRGCIDGKGWIWITGTPLAVSWMRDVIEGPSSDPDDPMSRFAQVFRGGTMHRNCRACAGGYLDHDWIEAFLAGLSPEERRARDEGEYLDQSKLAFPMVSDAVHLVDSLY